LTIGDNIKELRKSKKITQQELSDKTGISISAINKYENNKRQPKTDMVIKISKALNAPISDLITGELIISEFISSMSNWGSISNKPFSLEGIEADSKPYGALKDFLRTQKLQKELDYSYTDLVTEDNFDEIYKFIIDMLRMKISEIKSRKNK
jgi:transcriptional regulator with XRE-family HTH domain